MSGKKGQKAWNKRKVFDVNRLSELAMKRAIGQMEREETKIEDRKDKFRLEDRKDEITLKVLDKVIAQEIKLSGNGPKEIQIILIRDHVGTTSDQANELSRSIHL